jgi:hypothetical protein
MSIKASPNVKIAILGWGSLISKPEGDATIGQKPLRITGKFVPGGPSLPIEFSRISKDGRLTLVIDPIHGTPCDTFYAVSLLPVGSKNSTVPIFSQYWENLHCWNAMKTKCKSIIHVARHSFVGVVYAGTVMLIASGAPAQNLFEADGGSGNIYEFTTNGVQTLLPRDCLLLKGWFLTARATCLWRPGATIFTSS